MVDEIKLKTTPNPSLKRRGNKDWIPDQVGDDNYLKPKVIAVLGPTASGKTGVGVKLAKEFNGEIVSADSRQVFRGLDLGTGKDLKEFDGVKYHMIDVADPCTTDEYRAGQGTKMTLFDYLPLARAAIDDILDRGKLPIIVGGTGLYVQALTEGFQLQRAVIPAQAGIQDSPHGSPGTTLKNTAGPEDDKLSREQLDKLTVAQLNEILEEIDPEKYATVDHKNRHRLIRAIELAQEGLKPTKTKPDFETLQIAIDLPRAELFERIDRRVDERFDQGMLEEVQSLLGQGISSDWLMSLGLEYRLITEFLVSGITYNVLGQNKTCNTLYEIRNTKVFDAMSQDLKYKIHQFARRQLTWLRRFPEINWLSDFAEIERFVKIFLEH